MGLTGSAVLGHPAGGLPVHGDALHELLVSRYLNKLAPSEQRATVLSFKGLSTNFAYGCVAILYSGLIASVKSSEDAATYSSEAAYQKQVFIESLQIFPWYFVVTLLLVVVVHRMRFRRAG